MPRLPLVAVTLAVCALAACGGPRAPEPSWARSQVVANGLDHPTALALDGRHLFLVTGGTVASLNEGTSALVRLPLDGGAPPEVLVRGSEALMPDGGSKGEAIAVDADHVYFGTLGSIYRVRKAGGAPELLSDLARPTRIVLDRDAIFWADAGYESGPPQPIRSVARAGGQTRIVVDPAYGMHDVCVDADYLYWAQTDGLKRMAKAGGPIETFYAAPEGERTLGLRLDGETFVFTQSREKLRRHALMRVDKDGRNAVELAPSVSSVNPLAVDETSIYFVDDAGMFRSKICRVPKAGGEVVVLDEGVSVRSLVARSGECYFSDVSNVYRIGAPGAP